MLILAGWALAYAINSGTVLAGTDGFTTMTWRLADDARDRRDVVDKIEIELLIQGGVDRVRHADQQQRVAVCWTTASVPILPPPPGRFSMTNGWPSPL
jgi:hypothetical protein